MDRRVQITLVEPLDELVHEPGQQTGRRPRVGGDGWIVNARDVDRPLPEPARPLSPVRLLHHEVQAVEQPEVVAELGAGIGERLNIGHRPLVILQLPPCHVAGLQRRFSGHQRFHVVDRSPITLDGARTDDSPGGEAPPQLFRPLFLRAEVYAKVVAHLFEVRENSEIGGGQLRRCVEHDSMIRK